MVQNDAQSFSTLAQSFSTLAQSFRTMRNRSERLRNRSERCAIVQNAAESDTDFLLIFIYPLT
jgi:hypothetical protein